jgi:steroid 5-alpha reductase family enzyme
MSDLAIAVWSCGGVALACFALSVITREYSWVDRLWSLLPPLYVGWFAWAEGFQDPRVNLMLALSALWGARLTYNFARKGGYAAGGEDYRWAELRRRMHPALFQVFNFFFTAGFQNALLLALAVPAWVAARAPTSTPLGALDVAFAALFLLGLLGETIADNQQWRFQTEKKAKLARGEAVEQQFVTSGLFAYSRHPNFFCEQLQWWAFYALGVHASGEWLGIGLIGAAVLTALFHGSTQFTEELSLAKYPAYADYQRRVSRLLPWWPRRDANA